MAFSPSFIDTVKSRVSIAEIVGRRVSWDAKKSVPAKGDYWGCCPFHGEKTPSFHVRDREGYFHCFGCGEKGSVFDFLMKIDNLSFPETVEQLAAEAGLALPERDPRARERAKQQASLTDIMAQAADFFRDTLASPAGDAARRYLRRRGLSSEMMTRFALGYAPNARQGVTRRLQELGATEDQLVEVNLSMRPDDGGAPFDRFRDRLMFPITDPRGRVIAFGGRAMSEEAKAKYLNSSETPLFSKGRVLFNLHDARVAAGRGEPLIVAEGYTDVIALVGAGFEGAVAPLGTALTEQQLALLWRAADEPVIALDGDEAGMRAAYRVADLALARLAPGKSVNFALMPDGRDPDDLIRTQGPEAMRALVQASTPLIDLIWDREVAATRLDTPERRAAFDARIHMLVDTIADIGVRRHYERALKDRRFAQYRALDGRAPKGDGGPHAGADGGFKPGRGGGWRDGFARGGFGRGGRFEPAPRPTADTLANPLISKAKAEQKGGAPNRILEHQQRRRQQEESLRSVESVLLLGVLNHPRLADEKSAALEAQEFSCPRLDTIRNAILFALAEVEPLDAPDATDRLRAIVMREVGPGEMAYLEAEGAKRLPTSLEISATHSAVSTTYSDILNAYASKVMRREEGKEYVTEMSLAKAEQDGLERFGTAVSRSELLVKDASSASEPADDADEAKMLWLANLARGERS